MSGLLAVYGTLKKGYANHTCVKHLPFVGKATSVGHFTMYDGAFPVVVEEPYHRVAVELFSFEDEKDIAKADQLENHPDWYERKQFPFLTEDGTEVQAWMYVMPRHRWDRHKKVRTDQFNVATWV